MANRGGERKDGRTEGRKDRRKDGRTSGNSPCVLQDIGPLGPLPKKEERKEKEKDKYLVKDASAD